MSQKQTFRAETGHCRSPTDFLHSWPALTTQFPVEVVRPGITGWAQINGGNLVTTEEKGALDDCYVQNASLWLDLRIALYTAIFLFTGERRGERAVHDATLLQQTNGHSKVEERNHAEIREITTARRQLSPMPAVKVLPATAGVQRRVANNSAQPD